MSGIALRMTSDLDKTAAALAKMSGRVQVAIARGLNEGGDLVRTKVRAAMREQTGLVRLNSVTSRSRTARAYGVGREAKSGIGPTRPASLTYTIIFVGKPTTKPSEFKKQVKRGAGGGVTVWMWGVAHTFKRSFQQKLLGGLRMRLGGERLPIRGFDGPNLAKEAVKGKVAETFLTQASAVVPPRIDKHLARLI